MSNSLRIGFGEAEGVEHPGLLTVDTDAQNVHILVVGLTCNRVWNSRLSTLWSGLLGRLPLGAALLLCREMDRRDKKGGDSNEKWDD